MTNKRILWGQYSVGRLRQRGITRQMVRFVLARGIRQLENTLHGEQRSSRRAYIAHRELKVIMIERATEIQIVTPMWVGDKPE